MILDFSFDPNRAARFSVATFLAAKAEIERRARAEEFRSLSEDSNSPFSDLWSGAPFVVLYGGRGAAKDWSVAEVLLKRMRKEPNMLVLCTREYQNSIADSVHRLLRQMIYRLQFDREFDITDKTIRHKTTGGEFIFKGLHHNSDEIKSTEGVKVTWVAEAQNTTEDSWVNLLPTVFRVAGAQLIVSFNVTDEQSPTHRRFVTNPPAGAKVHKVNYTENPHFPEGLRLLMEQDRALNPDLFRHIWLGEPKHMSNALVLGGCYHIQEFPDDLWQAAKRLFFGADFGFSNDPSTLVRSFALSKKKIKDLGLAPLSAEKGEITRDRLYIEYEAGGVGVELDELPALYDSIPLSREWPIKGDNARPETISHLKGKGFNITAAEKWKGSVEDGIAHLRSHWIIIHPRCVHTAAEAGTYSYKVDPRVIDPNTNAPQVLPILIDAHNHYIDAERYALDGYIQKRGGLIQWERLAR